MTRAIPVLIFSLMCGVSQAQDAGGAAGAEGGVETSDFGGQGIQTGPTVQTESGFAAPETSGFAAPGGDAGFNARTFNGGGQQRQIITGGNTQTQRQVRPTFRLGFVPSASLLTRSRQQAVSRFTTITPRVRELRGMSMSSNQNGIMTIRGQATSRYGSLLAAAIARLEPGVRSVRNEIRIAPAPAMSRPVPMDPTPIAPPPVIESRPSMPVQGSPAATPGSLPLAPIPVPTAPTVTSPFSPVTPPPIAPGR